MGWDMLSIQVAQRAAESGPKGSSRNPTSRRKPRLTGFRQFLESWKKKHLGASLSKEFGSRHLPSVLHSRGCLPSCHPQRDCAVTRLTRLLPQRWRTSAERQDLPRPEGESQLLVLSLQVCRLLGGQRAGAGTQALLRTTGAPSNVCQVRGCNNLSTPCHRTWLVYSSAPCREAQELSWKTVAPCS